MVGWFCCKPGLHHIANFLRTEGCSELEKKIVVFTFSIRLIGVRCGKFYGLFSRGIIDFLKVLCFLFLVLVVVSHFASKNIKNFKLALCA